MVARLAVAVALALLLSIVPPTTGNHPGPVDQGTIAFDHKTGNEWWVEVVLTGSASGSVTGVHAMDDVSWVPLKKGWGAWGASFRIEPGHQVRFLASWADGDTAVSCWFSHPAGIEQCGSGSPTTSGSGTSTVTSSTGPSYEPPGSRYDADFNDVKGNEWWVQANVLGNHGVSQVDARVGCTGTWRPLTMRDPMWNTWAASFHIPSGSKVDFRASPADGGPNDDVSDGYVWPAATRTSGCGSSTTTGSSTGTTTSSTSPTGGSFDATFTGVRGNEWWVQAQVATNGPAIARVDVSLDGGDWKPVARQSWGWGVSYHVVQGTVVQLRATSTDGQADLSSCRQWIPPSGQDAGIVPCFG